MHGSPARSAPLPALLAAILLAACVGESASLTESGNGSPLPSLPTATASPPAGAPQITWSETQFDGRVDDVIADGSRFVAVGGAEGARTAWTSTDGVSWEAHPVPQPPMPDDCLVNPDDPLCSSLRSTGMGRLLRLDDTVYSFASLQGGGDGRITVGWRWTDGGRWEVIQSTSEFFTNGGYLMYVTASDAALLAVTSRGLAYPGADETWLWTSTTSWIRGGLASMADEPISIDVVSWSPRLGLFFAAGRTYTALADKEPEEWPVAETGWSSADGRAWNQVALPSGVTSICGLNAITEGFVIAGNTDDGPAVWTSPDGASWTAAARPEAPDEMAPCGVLQLGDGLLGLREGGDIGTSTFTWTSKDGSLWEPGATLALGRKAAAAIGSTIVLFGSRGDTPNDSAASVLMVGTVKP